MNKIIELANSIFTTKGMIINSSGLDIIFKPLALEGYERKYITSILGEWSMKKYIFVYSTIVESKEEAIKDLAEQLVNCLMDEKQDFADLFKIKERKA